MAYKNIVITPPKVPNQDTAKESQFYRGFSTIDNLSNVKIYDSLLVKQDLINHFNTKKGERLMNPEFGTIIWDLLYDPLTEALKQDIEADVRTILNSDPRINPIAVSIDEKDFGILIEVSMTYSANDESDTMRFAFDKDAGLIAQ
jgi:phage baseplate assembly protein W